MNYAATHRGDTNVSPHNVIQLPLSIPSKYILLAVFFTLPTPAAAVTISFSTDSSTPAAKAPFWPEGLKVSLSSLGYYKGFSGDRRRASGRVNQGLTQDDLSIRFGRTYADGLNVQQELAGRYTNDRALSPNKDFILQSFFLSVERANRFAARVGNIIPNFSRYTLGSSMQGLNGYGQRGPLRVSGVAARQEEIDGRRFRRWTTGGRVEALDVPIRSGGLSAAVSGISGGLSLVGNTDDAGSINNTLNVQKVDALVFGADARINFKRNVSMSMEAAGSNFRDNRERGKKGMAASADLDWKPGKLGAGLSFEHQDHLFRSPSGSASPDMRRLGPRLSYRFADWASANGTMELTRNNARGQLASTTLAQTYGTGFTLKPLGWQREHPLKDFSTNFGLRLNRQRATDGTSRRQTRNYDLGATHALGPWGYGFGYALQHDRDLLKEANNRNLQAPKANLSYSWKGPQRWNLSLSPTLAWSYSRDTTLKTGAATKTTTWDLGLGGTVDGARFGFGYGTTSSSRPAPTGASHQTRLKADLSQSLAPGLSLTANFNFNYSKEQDSSRNFAENQWSVGVRYEF